ncbi:MAG: response regulator [Treponema sp.]|nr:response regulator [Treponema sp.]
MAKAIFVCEKEFEDSDIVEQTRKFLTVIPTSFAAFIANPAQVSADIVLIYLRNLTPSSEETIKKLWQTGCNLPVIFIGTRENCVNCCVMGTLIVKQYIYTPIDLKDYLEQIRHLANELEGKEDPVDEFGNILPVQVTPYHILVVDDDVISLRTMMNWLKDTYRVSVVKSGSAAVNFLEVETPDLILLDYEMPDYDGPETLKMIRSKNKNAKIPVIFLTGVTDSDMIKNAIMQKPQGYILKTTNKASLLEKIRDILKLR